MDEGQRLVVGDDKRFYVSGLRRPELQTALVETTKKPKTVQSQVYNKVTGRYWGDPSNSGVVFIAEGGGASKTSLSTPATRGKWFSAGEARRIAKVLGPEWVVICPDGKWWGGDYGNASQDTPGHMPEVKG